MLKEIPVYKTLFIKQGSCIRQMHEQFYYMIVLYVMMLVHTTLITMLVDYKFYVG